MIHRIYNDEKLPVRRNNINIQLEMLGGRGSRVKSYNYDKKIIINLYLSHYINNDI